MGVVVIAVHKVVEVGGDDKREDNKERLPLDIHKDNEGEAESEPDGVRRVHRGDGVHSEGGGGLFEGEQVGGDAGALGIFGIAVVIVYNKVI